MKSNREQSFFRINNAESPFDVRIFNDLKKYFRNETVYYSINDELNKNIFFVNKIDNDSKFSNKIGLVNIDRVIKWVKVTATEINNRRERNFDPLKTFR